MEKREEELQKQEKNYRHSLLELSIKFPEIRNFVEEDLEVDKMSLEELTALFASGDFSFNFADDDIPGTDPSENLELWDQNRIQPTQKVVTIYKMLRVKL
jgi:hypothetical protein